MPTNPSDGSSGKKTGEGSGGASDDSGNSTSTLLGKGGDGAQRESAPTERSASRDERVGTGDAPAGPGKSDAPAANAPGTDPQASSTATPSTSGAVDRWGDLPVYARDVFRAEGGADFPSAYREFIDAYYKRLNRRR